MSAYSPRRRAAVLASLTLALLAVALASLSSGVITTTLGEVLTLLPQALAALWSTTDANGVVMILAEIRLPRLLLGMLVGAALAVCGAVMQGLFRNPMADPGLLGVSSGAALGAVLAIVLLGAWLAAAAVWVLPLAAFGGGLSGMFLVHRLAAGGDGSTDIATMLLAGIAVNAIAGAFIGLASYVASDSQLRDLIFWSLGSLEITDRRTLAVALLVMLPALALLPGYAGALNANLLGEREAGHLGFDMERIKRRLIVLVALLVGAAVCLSGVIGFVGLLVPHLIRLLTGPDHRLLLPASALAGAALLTAADIIARTLVAPAEVPIGVMTALIGGPFFLWLLVRYRRARALR